MTDKLVGLISELKETEAIETVDKMLAEGKSTGDFLSGIRQAMEIVGKRFENNEYFLPELIMAGEIMSKIKELLKSKQSVEEKPDYKGKVVLGTVKGDIHNIGKDIVSFMLDTNGYEVIDLGIDVPPEKFVEAVRDTNPQVLGLSAFLTPAFDAMKNTISEVEKNGLRENLKVMIGGGQMDDQVCRYTGADGYGRSAVDAVNLVKNWIGG